MVLKYVPECHEFIATPMFQKAEAVSFHFECRLDLVTCFWGVEYCASDIAWYLRPVIKYIAVSLSFLLEASCCVLRAFQRIMEKPTP